MQASAWNPFLDGEDYVTSTELLDFFDSMGECPLSFRVSNNIGPDWRTFPVSSMAAVLLQLQD